MRRQPSPREVAHQWFHSLRKTVNAMKGDLDRGKWAFIFDKLDETQSSILPLIVEAPACKRGHINFLHSKSPEELDAILRRYIAKQVTILLDDQPRLSQEVAHALMDKICQGEDFAQSAKSVAQAFADRDALGAPDYHAYLFHEVLREAFGMDGRVPEEGSPDLEAADARILKNRLPKMSPDQPAHQEDGIDPFLVMEAQERILQAEDHGQKDERFYLAIDHLSQDVSDRLGKIIGAELPPELGAAVYEILSKAAIAYGPDVEIENRKKEEADLEM